VEDPPAALRALRAITAEAVIRQVEAEDLLAGIRRREPLAELAPRGGRLTSRFVALREALPQRCDDADVRRYTRVLRAVFDHHALMLSSSMELLAFDWRSQAIVDQIEKIDGLGPPAMWLEEIRREVVRRTDTMALA
jgi:hypothetical protein